MLCKVCREDLPQDNFADSVYANCIIGCSVAACRPCSKMNKADQKRSAKDAIRRLLGKPNPNGDERRRQKAWSKLSPDEKRSVQIERRTPSERNLERSLKLKGISHDVQVRVGCYFVDFQITPFRLAVEVDGGIHSEAKNVAYDAKRTKWLNKAGWTVIRFTNRQIADDVEGVVRQIVLVRDDKTMVSPQKPRKGKGAIHLPKTVSGVVVVNPPKQKVADWFASLPSE